MFGLYNIVFEATFCIIILPTHSCLKCSKYTHNAEKQKCGCAVFDEHVQTPKLIKSKIYWSLIVTRNLWLDC